MIVAIVLAFVLLGIIQTTIFVRKKQWWDMTVFCAFFVLSFVMCLLQASGVKLPSPTKGIKAFLDQINLHF